MASQLVGEDDIIDDPRDVDPDAKHDPNSAINLQQYLTEFLQSFSSQPYFSPSFLGHLNTQEKQVLTMVGIQL